MLLFEPHLHFSDFTTIATLISIDSRKKMA